MSSNYPINVGLYFRDYGAQRGFNQAAHGAALLERRMATGTRQMGQWDQATRAFGTTLRYAFAGAAIFGSAALVRNLSQVEKQLGLISAIGGKQYQGQGLQTLFQDAQMGAINSLQPLAQFNDALINILSTVQNIPRKQLVPLAEDIAKTATLAQTSAEDAAKGLTTLNIAAGRTNNLANIHVLGQELFSVISEVPGGPSAGREIINQMGPLSAAMVAGRMTPEQLNALATASLRFGGTPATSLRGLRSLLQSITLPTGKAQLEELGKVGITPGTVQKEGAYATIMKILRHAQGLGVHSRRSTQQLANLDESALAPEGTDPTLPGPNLLGLSGEGSSFLRKTIRTPYGLRAAAILMAQLDRRGDVASIQEDLRMMAQATMKHAKQVHDIDKAWQSFVSNAPLTQAGIALNTLSTSLIAGAKFPLDLGAKGLTAGAKQVVAHPHVTQAVEGALAATLLSRGVASKFPKYGAMLGKGRLGRLLGGKGNPIGALIAAEEAPALIGGGGPAFGPMGSRANPMWVVIARDFDKTTMPGGGGIDANDPLKKLPPAIPFWAKGLGWGLGAIAADEISARATTKVTGKKVDPIYKRLFHGSTYTEDVPRNLTSLFTLGGLLGGSGDKHRDRQRKMLESLNEKDRRKVIAMSPFGAGRDAALKSLIEGKLKVGLELTGPGKKLLKLAQEEGYIPVKFRPPNPPSHRGKNTTFRSGSW